MLARRQIATAVVAGVLSTATACAGRPHPTLAELKKLPVTRIDYPGAVTCLIGGTDSNRKFGVNRAIWQKHVLIDQQPSIVLAWYQQQLVSAGWTRDDTIVVLDGAQLVQGWGWTDGARSIRLNVVGSDWQRRIATSYPQCSGSGMMYEVLLQ